jgi:hypothetical protein
MKPFIFALVFLSQFLAAPAYRYLVMSSEGGSLLWPSLAMIALFLLSIVVYVIDASRNYTGQYKPLFLVLLIFFHVVVAPYYWYTHVLKKAPKGNE